MTTTPAATGGPAHTGSGQDAQHSAPGGKAVELPAPPHSPRAALDGLAAALGTQDFITTLAASAGQPLRLSVVSRHARQLTEDIYTADGWYWWSWAERIAPVDDTPSAAGKIAAVLRASPSAHPTAPTGNDAA